MDRVDFFHQVLDRLMDRDDVAISFDDGNISDLTQGLPGLLDRGQTATFFALAGRLGQAGSLAAADLQELRAQGMVIGTHGMHHVPWRGLTADGEYQEFVLARDVLAEAFGGPVEAAALPLGRYDRRVLSRLRALGYQRVYSSDRLPARRTSWFQPRYSVRASDTVESLSAILKGPSVREALASGAKVRLKQWR